jgi:hypothetical protein
MTELFLLEREIEGKGSDKGGFFFEGLSSINLSLVPPTLSAVDSLYAHLLFFVFSPHPSPPHLPFFFLRLPLPLFPLLGFSPIWITNFTA